MDTTQQQRLKAAFDLLAEVVGEYQQQGRRCYSATLKPNMRSRNPEFFEGLLGFASFREFLRAAQSAGVVDLVPTLGPDVIVTPPGQARRTEERYGGRRPAVRRIRADIWKAFFDWTPGLKRVLDREAARVLIFTENPNPLESDDAKAAREAVASDPDRYIRINPISMDEQRSWMQEFADSLTDKTFRDVLHAALMSDRPIQNFNQAARATPGGAQWHEARYQNVQRRIESFLAEHGIEMDIYEPELVSPQVGGASAEAPVHEADLDALRRTLHAAIDRMPRAELLKISVPLEYLVDRG